MYDFVMHCNDEAFRYADVLQLTSLSYFGYPYATDLQIKQERDSRKILKEFIR